MGGESKNVSLSFARSTSTESSLLRSSSSNMFKLILTSLIICGIESAILRKPRSTKSKLSIDCSTVKDTEFWLDRARALCTTHASGNLPKGATFGLHDDAKFSVTNGHSEPIQKAAPVEEEEDDDIQIDKTTAGIVGAIAGGAVLIASAVKYIRHYGWLSGAAQMLSNPVTYQAGAAVIGSVNQAARGPEPVNGRYF